MKKMNGISNKCFHWLDLLLVILPYSYSCISYENIILLNRSSESCHFIIEVRIVMKIILNDNDKIKIVLFYKYSNQY